MFNKVSTKYLLIVFLGLLTLVLLTVPAGNHRKNRSFKSEITNFNADQVSTFTIYPRASGGLITFERKDDNWTVSGAGGTYNADNSQVENLLNMMSQLKATRLAARGKENWDKYEVTDSLGTRVAMWDGEKELADLYVGKFSYIPPSGPANPYQQAQGTMISYVRCNREKEVYAVEGFLGMSFNRQLKDFRDGNVLQFRDSDLESITVRQNDQDYSILNHDSAWMVRGIEADSAAMAGYLSGIRSLRSMNFLSEEQLPVGNPTHQLIIQGKNGEQIARIDAFFTDSSHIAISSSINPGTWFDGSQSDLFGKLYKDESEFIKN